MNAVMEYLSSHPAILTGIIIFIIIVILYFIIKQFIKIALVLLLIALLAGGYYYFQSPGKMSEKVKKSIDTVQSGADKAKGLYKDSKELIDKAQKIPGKVDRIFNEEADKTKK